MADVALVCPNLECPARSVDGDLVSREAWDGTLIPGGRYEPDYYADGTDCCPACGYEGTPDDHEVLLGMREEEQGQRCPECGVVSPAGLGGCPHCGEQVTT